MCEKCQGRGFIEENHGLILIPCDCEAGGTYRAKMHDMLGIPEELDDSSGVEQANTDTRGDGDSSESAKPKERKTKKRARKKSS